MINIDDKTRRLSQATIVIGYKQENKAESIEFEIPDYLKEYGKKICFKTKDGKVFSKLFDNTTSNIFTFTRTETQYGELDATIEFFKTENEDMVIYKTSMLHIIFNESIICEDEVQPDEPKIPILENLIEKVTELNNTITENEETRNNNENTRISNENKRKTNEKERETYYTNIQNKVNNGEFNGATFTPSVDKDGNISWTNNKGLENPSSQNIRGPQGIQGPQGEAFKIKKTYSSIEAMQADFDNMEVGDYAMIANSVEIEDNAKLYYKTETEWVFITDFSGATGIQGEQGPQGIQGIQGERGIGISKLEVIDGSLWVTLTDSTKQNAGLIITDEVKQWLVNEITNNAESNFSTYYDGKVTYFDNHVTVKTNEFNTNATNKVAEYNQNAESLINRVVECEAENERLRNDIKSIALQGEASGENIHIEDSSNARCEIEIGGNHQQDTREGYNKLDSSEFINSTQNGVTLKVNLDGTLTLNGTSTADTTFRILRTQKLIVGKANLKVIINQLENAIKTGTIRLVCQDENYENTIYSQIGTSTFYNNLKEGITYNIFSLVVSSGTICNNLKLGLVISENKTDYEQYGASPSIDYPSKVKSVGNIKNILDMSNAKGGTSGGITCTMNKDGSYTYNGSVQVNVQNKNLLNLSKIGLGRKYGVTATYNTNNSSITFNGTCTRDNTIFSISPINIPYEKNKTTMTVQWVSGSASGSYIGSRFYNSNFAHILSINLIPLNSTNKILNRTEGQNGTYIGFDFKIDKGTILDNFTVQVMLTNEVDTDYVPYQIQQIVLPVQQEMLEGDTFIRQDQKNYEYHNFAKKVLTGNENWETMRIQSNNIGYQFWLDNVAQGNRVSGIILSNSFVATTGEKVWDENKFGYKCGVDNFKDVRFSMPISEYPVLDVFKAKLKELYEAGTPVIIYYKLAEPILLECTEAQSKVLDEIYSKAHTYKNITNILAESSEVNPIINVKYLKDTEKYIEDKITTALTKINANN